MLLKNVHNKLVSKVNAIDTSGFFLKPNETLINQALKRELMTIKYLVLVDLLKESGYNAKITLILKVK